MSTGDIDIIKELLDFYSYENGGPGRLVIYASYRAAVKKLTEIVQHSGWAALPITSLTTNRKVSGSVIITDQGMKFTDTDIIDDFQDAPEEAGNMCIIGNPAQFHGLTLTRTECLVYYNNAFNYDARPQSEERRDRPGMDVSKGTRIVDIINLPTDLRIKEALETSDGLSNLTLQALKDSLNENKIE